MCSNKGTNKVVCEILPFGRKTSKHHFETWALDPVVLLLFEQQFLEAWCTSLPGVLACLVTLLRKNRYNDGQKGFILYLSSLNLVSQSPFVRGSFSFHLPDRASNNTMPLGTECFLQRPAAFTLVWAFGRIKNRNEVNLVRARHITYTALCRYARIASPPVFNSFKTRFSAVQYIPEAHEFQIHTEKLQTKQSIE